MRVDIPDESDPATLDAPEPCDACTSWREVEPQIFVCRRAEANMCPAVLARGGQDG